MIIIYYTLQTAGIETFITRLAEERKRKNLLTKLLLFDKKNSSKEIIKRISKVAEVTDIKDLLKEPFRFFGKNNPKTPGSFSILCEFNILSREKVRNLLENINMIHVTSPMNLHLSFRLLKVADKNIPVTAGFYHSDTFGKVPGKKTGYFEQKNFELIYELLPKQNLVIFNDMFPSIYKKRYNIKLAGVSMFPLGVIDSSLIDNSLKLIRSSSAIKKKRIKICSIGRLVDFKTYNIWMIDVVAQLIQEGFPIDYDIYGEGEMKNLLQEKINNTGITTISLKGLLPYRKFRSTVIEYDLFVGSGTAIIEAAALGIPSIIGIERIKDSLTYGYLCDVPGYTYNEEGVKELVSVKDIIKKFSQMSSDEIKSLQLRNSEKAKEFSLEICSENFVKLENNAGLLDSSSFQYSRFRYITSFLQFYFTNLKNRTC